MALATLSSVASGLFGARPAQLSRGNGTQAKLAMKSRSTWQVQIVVGEDEPQDNALKRFRREVMTTGGPACSGQACGGPLAGSLLVRPSNWAAAQRSRLAVLANGVAAARPPARPRRPRITLPLLPHHTPAVPPCRPHPGGAAPPLL